MKQDLKKRLAKKQGPKSGLDFEFVGTVYEDTEETEESKDTTEEEKMPNKMSKHDSVTDSDSFATADKTQEDDDVKIVEKAYTKYCKNLDIFLNTENISDEESDAVSQTPKFLHVSSSDDRDGVYNNEVDETFEQSTDSPKKDKMLKNSSLPGPEDDASNWDFFAYLTDKYGYEKFKAGIEIVKKSNMLRFTEDGEKKIKNEMNTILGKSDDVDAFYSD
jgi:hypothetical protein